MRLVAAAKAFRRISRHRIRRVRRCIRRSCRPLLPRSIGDALRPLLLLLPHSTCPRHAHLPSRLRPFLRLRPRFLLPGPLSLPQFLLSRTLLSRLRPSLKLVLIISASCSTQRLICIGIWKIGVQHLTVSALTAFFIFTVLHCIMIAKLAVRASPLHLLHSWHLAG